MIKLAISFLLAIGPLSLEADKPPIYVSNEATQIDWLARGLARAEGWLVPGSLVHRLHNPLALAYARQPLARRGPQSLAAFPTDEAGWQAGRSDIRAKMARGMGKGCILSMWSKRGYDIHFRPRRALK